MEKGSEKLISIYAVVESVGSDLVRASLMPPLKLEVVAGNWSTARKSLIRKLPAGIRKRMPTLWSKSRPISAPEVRRVTLTIDPSRRDYGWTESVDLAVDLIGWDLGERNRYWYCPALRSAVISYAEDSSDEQLIQEVENMLAQKLDKMTFESLLKYFWRREFRVEKVRDISARDVMRIYNEKPAKRSKRQLKSIRAIATRVVTWQHTPVFEREAQVKQLNEILLGLNRASVLLVGPPGVGKTALVYQWAKEIDSRRPVGTESKDETWDVWSTSGSRLVSGMVGFGMWQQRCHEVIREARDGKLVMHLGSLVELIESGKIDGQPGVGSLFRSAIDQGRVLAIAECTPEQLAIAEREDPLLVRAFTRVEIQPPNELTTRKILKSMSLYLAQDRERQQSLLERGPRKRKSLAIKQVEPSIGFDASLPLFDDSAIDQLYRLHQRFSTYSAMPGQPINMMRSMIDQLPAGMRVVDTDVVRRFASDVGLPLFLLDDSVPLVPEEIRKTLESEVIGQSTPIDRLVQMITMLKARLNRGDRPLASLLLIGPTGVGKTVTAKALAKLLYHDQSRMIRIDMSEYAQPWSAMRLIGTTNSGDGTLTSPIRDQPFSVVLLDEFEKSHPAVLDLLLQVLGEGRLTDSMGRIADFRNAVVILTSNLGVESYSGQAFGFYSQSRDADEHFLREVRRFVRPELLGRIDHILTYQPLGLTTVRKIVDRELVEVAKRSGLRFRNVDWNVGAEVRDTLARIGYDVAFGARPLRRAIEQQIVMPLADTMQGYSDNGSERIEFTKNSDVQSTEPVSVRLCRDKGASKPAVRTMNEEANASHVDFMRDLRFRGELLVRSQPYYAMENKIEQTQRLLFQTEKRFKATDKPSRIRALQDNIHHYQRELKHHRMLLDDVNTQVQEIRIMHRAAVERWHDANSEVDEVSRQAGLTLSSRLKNALIQLQFRPDQSASLFTLILLGHPMLPAKPLLDAYQRLAELQKWSVSLRRLEAYAPLRDPDSAEYQRTRANSRTAQASSDEPKPSLRLEMEHEDDSAVLRKEIDVYKVENFNQLLLYPERTYGAAITFQHADAASWLGEEDGVHHFLSSLNSISKRHRIRVIVHHGPLSDWRPFRGWRETPSLNRRDPRRIYDSGDQGLASQLIGRRIMLDSKDPVSGWLDMIESESDCMLWSSIGYRPIPAFAMAVLPPNVVLTN